ncbi:unnamed protein product, partial [Rotaria socialis]
MVGNTNIENRLYDLINRNPLLKSLFSWYDQQQQEEDNGIDQRTFLSSLIDNITNNLSKSKNQYRYNDCVKR